MSAAALRHRFVLFPVLLSALAVSAPARAQQADEPPAQPSAPKAHLVTDLVEFVAGGGLALAAHESGHVVFDEIFDASPGLKHIEFGPIPFFAVTHQSGLSPRREFTISSAGFWVQEGTNEWILGSRPDLRRRHAPILKGVFAFNILNSVGYGLVAFARAGPAERDTRGMSTIGIDERAIGAFVLAPAILDAYRYFNPDSKWAKWASRAAKVSGVLLILK